ncbi:MAG TPA: hypothetical protein VH596_12615 [Terriglobales bacterium]
MSTAFVIGAVLLFVAGAVPWGLIWGWARQEIKSKPKNNVV